MGAVRDEQQEYTVIDLETHRAVGINEVLNELIGYGEEAIQKINRFLTYASDKRLPHQEAMMAYGDAPLELGRSAIALENMVHGLEMIREGGRPDVAKFFRPEMDG